jgi:gamma-glutamylcyclotransferase (GGCT)/AIG2-like uncharacterized protein YtfP
VPYVFGYGSLVGNQHRVAVLHGHRRVWGVAMDNRVVIPDYKIFETPDGRRPAVDVTFLDLVPDPAGAVNGALLEVDEAALAVLDRRERQYERVDVTAHLEDPPGRVWTYVGRAEGRARVREGRPVVQRAYVELVERGFRALGAGEPERFAASTEPVRFPVQDLVRIPT